MNTKTQVATKKRNSKFGKLLTVIMTMACMFSLSISNALAFDNTTVTVNADNNTAKQGMGAIIGIILTITRYAGVGLLIFGVYEVVMSFMQNQPEAKTKGIIMALCGVVMISLKSLIAAFGVTIS